MGSIVPITCCVDSKNDDAQALEAEFKHFRTPSMRDVTELPGRGVNKMPSLPSVNSPLKEKEQKEQKKAGEVQFETPMQRMANKHRLMRFGSERHLLKGSLGSPLIDLPNRQMRR